MARKEYFSSSDNFHYLYEEMYALDFPNNNYKYLNSSNKNNSSNININVDSISKEQIDEYFDGYDIEQFNDIKPLTDEEIDEYFEGSDDSSESSEEEIDSLSKEEIDNLFNI